MWQTLIGIIVIGLMSFGVVVAQDDAPATEVEVISAENIARLGSVEQINFADLPEEAGEVENGWFAINSVTTMIAFTNQSGGIIFWNSKKGFVRTETPQCGLTGKKEGGFINGRFFFFSEDVFYSLHQVGGNSCLFHLTPSGDHFLGKVVDNLPGTPLNAWPGEPVWSPTNVPISIEWVELNTEQGDSLLGFWVEKLGGEFCTHSVLDCPHFMEPNQPANDPESVIRIGRVEPPLAVTVTEDGHVKRWNMETGEVTAEVQIDVADGLPIYGAVNAGGEDYLVWRDPASMALHLLNFETGEDEQIVELDGMYMPFIFLSSAADVIIGVNVDDVPVVVAWDVATGTRYDLGEYRECNRPPDMARLSQDGTTLVIGCDTGLDIWRVH